MNVKEVLKPEHSLDQPHSDGVGNGAAEEAKCNYHIRPFDKVQSLFFACELHEAPGLNGQRFLGHV